MSVAVLLVLALTASGGCESFYSDPPSVVPAEYDYGVFFAFYSDGAQYIELVDSNGRDVPVPPPEELGAWSQVDLCVNAPRDPAPTTTTTDRATSLERTWQGVVADLVAEVVALLVHPWGRIAA